MNRVGLVFLLVLLNTVSVHASPLVVIATEDGTLVSHTSSNQGILMKILKMLVPPDVDMRVKFYPRARAQALFKAGHGDVLLPGLSRHISSVNLFDMEYGLLISKNRQLSTAASASPEALVAAISQDTVGVVQGGVSESLAVDYHLQNIHRSSSLRTSLAKLFNQRVDALIASRIVTADTIALNYPDFVGVFEFVGPSLGTVPIGFSVSTKSPYHLQLKKAAATFVQEGGLAELLHSHGLSAKSNTKELVIASVNNPDMLRMQNLSKQFEAKHNVALKWVFMSEDTLRRRLQGDLALDGGFYDVMTLGAYEIPIWAERKWLVDLTPYIPTNYDLEDLLKPVRQLSSVGNALYGLPFYAESSMLYYRKDRLEALGLVMPNVPTYEVVLNFAKQLHKPEQQQYGICLRGRAGWGSNMAFVTTLINTFGGQWYNMRWQPVLDSPAWRAGLRFYHELLTNYGPPSPEQYNFVENYQMFQEGKCGLWIDATVAAGGLPIATTGYAQAPISTSPRGSAWLWSWNLAVPVSSQKRDLATQFITWATSKEYVRAVAKQFGWSKAPPGTRQSTYEYAEYKRTAPFAPFVLNAIQTNSPMQNTYKASPYHGIQYVNIPEFTAIGTRVGVLVEDFLVGKLSLDDLIQKIQRAAQLPLAKVHDYRARTTAKGDADAQLEKN